MKNNGIVWIICTDDALFSFQLKIKFDDDVDSNTFVYPSESSLLEDPERSLSPPLNGDSETIPNGQHPPKLKANTVIGNSSESSFSLLHPHDLRTTVRWN